MHTINSFIVKLVLKHYNSSWKYSSDPLFRVAAFCVLNVQYDLRELQCLIFSFRFRTRLAYPCKLGLKPRSQLRPVRHTRYVVSPAANLWGSGRGVTPGYNHTEINRFFNCYSWRRIKQKLSVVFGSDFTKSLYLFLIKRVRRCIRET